MDRGFLEAKMADVDRRAGLQKAGIRYIGEVIEVNEPRLREIYVPPTADETAVSEILFTETSRVLGRVSTMCVAPLPHTTHLRPELANQPQDVKTGWLRYDPAFSDPKPLPDGRVAHMLNVTDEGIAVLNGLRAATGLASVEEQHQVNLARDAARIARGGI